MLHYKGFSAVLEVDEDKDEIHGRVIGTTDGISFHAPTVAQAREEFKASVEFYLARCIEAARSPDKSFSGKFNVRLEPALHRALAIDAEARRVSLNDAVKRAVVEYLERAGVTNPYEDATTVEPAPAGAKAKAKPRRKAEPVSM